MVPILSRRGDRGGRRGLRRPDEGPRLGGLAELADTIDREVSADPPVCSDARLAEVDAIVPEARSGRPTTRTCCRRTGNSTRAAGWANAAINLGLASDYGGGIGWTLGQTGIDRAAGVVGWMIDGQPGVLVGTGPTASSPRTPTASTSRPGPATTAGSPATRFVDFVRAKGDGSDLEAGTIDILPGRRPRSRLPGHGGGERRARRPPCPRAATSSSPSTSVRGTSSPTRPFGRRSSCASTCRATWTRRPAGRDADLRSGPARQLGRRPRPAEARSRRAPPPGGSSRTPGWPLGTDGIYAKDETPPRRRILVRGDKA